jgi:hypothetical protein
MCPPYLDSLLQPELVIGGKVPGMADQTVALHRKITITTTASALGAFGIFAQLTNLSDSTLQHSTVTIHNSALYDGINYINSGSPVTVATPFGIPANTIGTYRVVSGCAVVQPQSSNLNLQGTIHAALLKVDGISPSAPGTSVAAAGLTVATLQNSTTYSETNAQTGAGSRVMWLPNDIHLLQFKAINFNWQTYESTMNEFVPCFVGVGFPASAPIRIDLYINYEVTPFSVSTGTSLLQGMESICPHSENPGNVWRKVLTKYSYMISSPFFGHAHRFARGVVKPNAQIYDSADPEDFLITQKYLK